jgi:Tol biopolymer transport system component
MVFSAVTRTYRLIAFPFDATSGKAGDARPLFGGSQEILTFDASPDGTAIAFTTGGTQEDLFIANADGTRLRQLTNDAARDRGAAWSPDGNTLYFYSNRDGAYHIWSIRADGGGLTRVTDPRDLQRVGAHNIYIPDVSPDGRTLAVQLDNDACAFVHLDRPAAQRLETFGKAIAAPKWSRDGRQLLVAVTGSPDIAVYSLDTRRLERVLSHGDSPRWLPDGRHIAFFETNRIGVLDLDTRAVTTTAFTPSPQIALDNLTPRFARDGSLLYARQLLEQGDVWLVQFGKE